MTSNRAIDSGTWGQVLQSYRPPGELEPEGTRHGLIPTRKTVGLQDPTPLVHERLAAPDAVRTSQG